MLKKTLNIGIVGAGGFAGFAVRAFLKVPGINVIAVTDINEIASRQLSADLSILCCPDIASLLAIEEIDLIYIATPPAFHFEQSKKALLLGKHVICEKPASLKTSEAEELTEIARTGNLLYVVNLMQRYNPLFTIVKTIIDEGILGNFLHGYFENYASDEFLAKNHWFWDEAKSGGIFIEHAVHFFDLFEGWLGAGKVVSAQQLQRPTVNVPIFDRVQATVLYEKGLVNFYHGFDQPKILDRQEMRLQFEQGEITLFEWVPVTMKFHGLISNESLQRLETITSSFVMKDRRLIDEKLKKVTGRFREICFDQHVAIEFENAIGKQELYQQLLTNMITDQWSWIKDPCHHRLISDQNAVQSTRIAERANLLSEKF